MPIDVSTVQAHAGIAAAKNLVQVRPMARPIQGDVMKTEPPVSMDAILSELSDLGSAFNKRLSFSLNEKLDQVVVKVIDTDTDKVIREIPPAELQHVHERIREVIGILFDERV
jgi:flagellar protein FlaG